MRIIYVLPIRLVFFPLIATLLAFTAIANVAGDTDWPYWREFNSGALAMLPWATYKLEQ